MVPADDTRSDVTLAGTFSFDDSGDLPVVGANRITWTEEAPSILAHPSSARLAAGTLHVLSVEATGAQPLTYQWIKDESDVPGATESTLVFESLTLGDAGEYAVIINNAAGEVESETALLDVTPPNLSACGRATQSTTFANDAALAIDGSFAAGPGSTSATGFADPTPWWEVRLSADAHVETIVLWNRLDTAENLVDFRVLVLNDAREEIWSDDFFPPGAAPAFPDPALGGFEIDVGVEGRIVRIEKNPEDPGVLAGSAGLSLAEVEIFSDAPCDPAPEPVCPNEGDEEFGDTTSDELLVVPTEDDGPGHYAFTASGSDATGDPVLYTFTAVHNTNGTTIARGPQEFETALLPLTFGSWEVTVSADDHLSCGDVGVEASRTLAVDVVDPTCDADDLCNVAIRGFARQSSDFLFAASAAIDGNTDGDVDHNSVTHTGFDDPAPRWEVELDQSYDIESIVLWNRTDCCSERLTNFVVKLYSLDDVGTREEVYSEEFFTDGLSFPDTTVEGFSIAIDGETARVVEIALLDTHPDFNPTDFFLSLAEVQIFAPIPDANPGATFVRGNADGDAGGSINITDGVFELNYLFSGGTEPPCFDAADADNSGQINITDPVYILNFLFAGGPDPLAPYPECGTDPGPADELACETRDASCG